MGRVSTAIDAVDQMVATAKIAVEQMARKAETVIEGTYYRSLPGSVPTFTDRLRIGQKLLVDNMLVSAQGGWNRLLLQADGNLVMWCDSYDGGVKNAESTVLWTSGSFGANPELSFQGDGNLVLRSGSTVKWASGTNGKGGKVLLMQADGNLVMMQADGTVVWDTSTLNYAPYKRR